MPHEIMDSRFYGNRQGAWHGLGTVNDKSQTAQETLQLIGSYKITLEPIGVPTHPGLTLPEHRVILRHPTDGDEKFRSFGMVGPEYTLVTPDTAARIWDEHVGAPVETMGILRDGECLFITAKLPSFEVGPKGQGDEIEDYLAFCSWMRAGTASLAMQTPVRVVCANTMRWGEDQATDKLRLIHDSNVIPRTADWLRGIYQRAVDRQADLIESCNLLASLRLGGNLDEMRANAVEIMNAAIPQPPEPGKNAPKEVVLDRMERWERACNIVEERKSAWVDLFKGAGTGMDTPAAYGTLWGFAQAGVELINFGKIRGGPATAYESVLVGARGDELSRLWSATMDVAKRN